MCGLARKAKQSAICRKSSPSTASDRITTTEIATSRLMGEMSLPCSTSEAM